MAAAEVAGLDAAIEAEAADIVDRAAVAGAIINISSTAYTHGYPLHTPYAAAKWDIVGLGKSLAMDLGRAGIRVNAICPGSVEGPRMAGVIRREARARGSRPRARLRRPGLDARLR